MVSMNRKEILKDAFSCAGTMCRLNYIVDKPTAERIAKTISRALQQSNDKHLAHLKDHVVVTLQEGYWKVWVLYALKPDFPSEDAYRHMEEALTAIFKKAYKPSDLLTSWQL